MFVCVCLFGLFCLFVYLLICLLVFVFVCICLFVYFCLLSLFVFVFACLVCFVYLFVDLFVSFCVCLYLFVYLFVCLFILSQQHSLFYPISRHAIYKEHVLFSDSCAVMAACSGRPRRALCLHLYQLAFNAHIHSKLS